MDKHGFSKKTAKCNNCKAEVAFNDFNYGKNIALIVAVHDCPEEYHPIMFVTFGKKEKEAWTNFTRK